MSAVCVGQRIRVVQRGTVGGHPKQIEFYATITYVDARRAEYAGDGHTGGFALDAPLLNKMTSYGGIFLLLKDTQE